jgi:hypothetical protein
MPISTTSSAVIPSARRPSGSTASQVSKRLHIVDKLSHSHGIGVESALGVEKASQPDSE